MWGVETPPSKEHKNAALRLACFRKAKAEEFPAWLLHSLHPNLLFQLLNVYLTLY